MHYVNTRIWRRRDILSRVYIDAYARARQYGADRPTDRRFRLRRRPRYACVITARVGSAPSITLLLSAPECARTRPRSANCLINCAPIARNERRHEPSGMCWLCGPDVTCVVPARYARARAERKPDDAGSTWTVIARRYTRRYSWSL